jgi:DNA-directed RNA polymerase specialized sigma24 family protein
MLSWMFKIMNNAWIDEARARSRRDQIFAPEEAGEHVGVSPIDDHLNALAVRQGDRAPERRAAHRRRSGPGRGAAVQGSRRSARRSDRHGD